MESTLEAARQASLKGNHQQAVDLCVAVLRQTPGEPRALAFLALALWRASAFWQAVDVLQQALKHFPAQEELSLALLDSWLALGSGEHALRFAATLPEVLLAKPIFRSRIEDRLVALLNAGEFDQMEAELLPLMRAQPRWTYAQTLLASVMFNASGRGLHTVVLQSCREGETASEIGERWRRELAVAMSDYRRKALEQLRVALGASPTDDHAQELRTRLRFEEGMRLDGEELQRIQQQLGFGLNGPFPLKQPLDGVKGVRLLEPARLLTVPEPRRFGGSFQLEGAVGLALTSARYVATFANATVAAGSDAVLLEGGEAWCDSLAHPLGEFASFATDSWIALGATRQLMLRNLPVTRLHGTAVSLLGSATGYYGHWLLDSLVRLRAIEQHPHAAQAVVLVDDGMPVSHYQALQLILGRQAKLRRIARGCCVRVDRLLVSGPEVFFPQVTRNGSPSFPSIAPTSIDGLAFLRARVHAALPPKSARLGRRLIVRRRSATRRVLNEDALSEMLVRDWGFEELHPEALDFEDQVRRFRAAEIVIGAQGSAMSNCVFCEPGTLVVSLCSTVAANFPSWAHALEQLGVRHCFVVGQAEERSHPLPIQRDMRIDEEALRDALIELNVMRAAKPPECSNLTAGQSTMPIRRT